MSDDEDRDPRWTDGTVELVREAVSNAPWENDEVRTILAALADAKLLVTVEERRLMDALLARPRGETVTEYGTRYTGGGVLVWPTDTPELVRIFPLADRIEAGQRNGGKVVRRRVIVVDDWVTLRKGAKR